MGDWRILLKPRRDDSFKKGLSNEPNFGRIHLAGLYCTFKKLFEWLFSRVLASHHGGPGSIPGRDMLVLGPLVQDEDDFGQVFSTMTLLLRLKALKLEIFSIGKSYYFLGQVIMFCTLMMLSIDVH